MARRERTRPGSRSTPRVGHRGREGQDKVQDVLDEQERNRTRNGAFRFRMKKGTEASIIVLDKSMDDLFYLYEHAIPGPGQDGWKNTEEVVCVKEHENCPICELAGGSNERFKNSYYCMVLTILDLTPWESKDGSKSGDYTKRLMVIKANQIADFSRLMDVCEQKHGTIRGMELLLARDGGKNNMSPAVGKPIPDNDANMYYLMTEAELEDEFGHDAETGREGQVLKEADEDIMVFDYEELFPYPDVEELAARYGGRNTTGRTSDGWDEDDQPSTRRRKRRRHRDEEDDGEEDAPRTRSRSRSRRSRDEDEEDTGRSRGGRDRRSTRSRREDPEDDYGEDDADERDEDEDDHEEERGRSRSRTRTRSRSRSRDRDEDPEEDDEDEDEPRKRGSRGRVRTRTRSRDADEDVDDRDEDDGEDDDPPPQRKRTRSRKRADEDEEDAPKTTRKRGRSRSRGKPSGRNLSEEIDDEIPF